MTPETVLEFIIQTGALGLLSIILIFGFLPALRRIGTMQVLLQKLIDQNERLSDQNEQMLQAQRDTIHLLGRTLEHTRRVRAAIRVAFYGRSNGHTWEEAKQHYRAASEVLADDEADALLNDVEAEVKRMKEKEQNEPNPDGT